MTVGEVVESRAEGFAAGDVVWHASGWRDHAVVHAGEPALRGLGTLRRLDSSVAPPRGLPRPARRHGPDGLRRPPPRRGVARRATSSGSRRPPAPSGSLAAQIAKLRGHRVIGSAGSPDEGRVPARRARPRRGVRLPRRPARRSCCARRRPTASTSTSTTSAATTSRPRWRALRRGAGSRCAAPSRTTRARRAGPRNLFQATANDLTLRGFRGSSHVHRLPELHRDMGALARRRPHQDERDGLRRARARARGARAHARRRDRRQDARAGGVALAGPGPGRAPLLPACAGSAQFSASMSAFETSPK